MSELAAVPTDDELAARHRVILEIRVERVYGLFYIQQEQA